MGNDKKEQDEKEEKELPIFNAVRRKLEPAEFVKILNENENIDCVDKQGKTPLQCAAVLSWSNEEPIHLQCLLEHGAKVDVPDNFGSTALTDTCRLGRAKACKILIKKGANVNHETTAGWTPLLFAAANGHLDCVNMLLQADVDTNHESSKGHIALPLAAFNGHTEVCDALIRQGANIHQKFRYPENAPIHLAAMGGHVATMDVLCTMGADINHKNKWSQTPLHQLLEANHLDTKDMDAALQWFIDKNASFTIVDHDDETAMTLLDAAKNVSDAMKERIKQLNPAPQPDVEAVLEKVADIDINS